MIRSSTASSQAKRVELLHEMVPAASAIGVLANPDFPDVERPLKEVEEAARKLGLVLHVQKARSENDFDRAFATFVNQKVSAILVLSDALFLTRREQIIALAALCASRDLFLSKWSMCLASRTP